MRISSLNNRAFTLLELIVVMALIAITVSLAVPKIASFLYTDQLKVAVFTSAITVARKCRWFCRRFSARSRLLTAMFQWIKMPLFSNRSSSCQVVRAHSGFTLLEVMVAVAVIAIAFVTLIGAQSQSVAIATNSKFDTMASLLAQWKVAELHLQNYSELTSDTGHFDEDFPDFSFLSK